MTSMQLYCEPFARTGNIAAEGYRTLLGRPALGLLQTVIREAIQNSIDATVGDSGTGVLLRSRELSIEQRDVLRSRVLPSVAPDETAGRDLREVLDRRSIRLFEIADFNTSGLGGPTRADRPHTGPEDLDFVNFLRNVGAARDTHLGGGTYGYGKTSLYALSSCATILVDTQSTTGGQPVRRLMACQLGAAFEADMGSGRRRYTGRHWWGARDAEGGVEPVEGVAAAELAAALGLPDRSECATGTTIAILDPVLDHANSSDVVHDVTETVLWNFWPRMTRGTPHGRRLFARVEVDDQQLVCPDPEDFPPLDLFAVALEKCRSRDGVREIRCERPKKLLGYLSVNKGLKLSRAPAALRPGSMVPRQACHIAVMRPVELVVRYIEGESFADKRFEWGGVFICSDEKEVEEAFASAEPPAHDDWIPDNLPKGRQKTYVTVALRRLKEVARTHALPKLEVDGGTERGPSLALAASRLGKLLETESGTGPGRSAGRRKQRGPRSSTSVTRPRFERLELAEGGKPVAVFEAEFSNETKEGCIGVRAEPHLVMDGAATSAEDTGIEFEGRVLDLRIDDELVPGSLAALPEGRGRILCRVPMPSNAAVGLRLMLEELEPGEGSTP